jgi:3-oxoacyl-[acyl-carrier protein] reductase
MAGMDLGLRDRVYIVTGGSRGLGRATAEVLVAEGARVVVSSRSTTSVEAAERELDSRSATGVAADNADPDTPKRLIEAARTAYGRLDGALISVGGPAVGPVMQISDEQWHTAFDAVFLGAVRLARSVAESVSAEGSLVFVLSTSVREPIPGLAVSNGLRPGLAMLAKTMADELGPRGIRVNGLLPGRVDTERVRELDATTGDPDAARRAAAATIPLRRYGAPAEFGRAAAFLLSPAAGYITGTMLPVDGGITRAL